jgi:chemotaxis protein CheX
MRRNAMNVSYINPFISSTIDTFKTMLHADIQPGKPRIKEDTTPTFDISGVIGLSGDALGAIALSFPKVVALKIVSALLGTSIKVVGPELTDGIGELANIISGYAKQGLKEYHLSISLPNVIVGKNHSISAPTGVPTVIVPFNSSFGEFVLEISLKTK